MGSLNSLTKNELLALAKKNNITIQATMRKSELITILEHHISTCSFKPNNHKEKDHAKQLKQKLIPQSTSPSTTDHKYLHKDKIKISIPTKNIAVKEYEELTILPQSSNASLVIWNSDTKLDIELKAWHIKTESGLDILLPNYARSLFIDNTIIFNHTLQIFKIYKDNQRSLFREHRVSEPSYQDLSQLTKHELDNLMISSLKKKWSSDNNL